MQLERLHSGSGTPASTQAATHTHTEGERDRDLHGQQYSDFNSSPD